MGGGVGGGRFCHPRSISSKKIFTVRVRRWNTAQIRYFKGQVATTASADEWQLPKALVKLSIFPVRRVQTH